MKWVRKCPLLVLLLSTGLLFTIIGIGGKGTIYISQEHHLLKAPFLTVMFTGLHDGIYPWQLFTEKENPVMAQAEPGGEDPDSGDLPETAGVSSEADASASPAETATSAPAETSASAETIAPADTPVPAAYPTLQPSAASASGDGADDPEETLFPQGRIEPFRESTREEYLNHISADIYGDIGVQRAAAYGFTTVEESYFDDALFIGDSRTVGLRDYTDLSQHADFYCETSLSIYKVLVENFKGKGTVQAALKKKDYGKIYLMVGINELGRGTTEDFMAKYTEVVDTLREWAPDAKIIIQATMRVSGKKNSADAIFNNSNINARNNAIATLADNEHIFYIDVNEMVCDEEGNLAEEYTFDQIHLLGVYNDLCKQFLLSHGV